jgi:hypothetical protein
MPTLKTARGTVLYAVAGYTAPDTGNYEVVVPVFNLEIGAIQPDRFLREDNSPAAFSDLVPVLAGATVNWVRLSVSYPDGTLATIPQIEFGEVVLVAWSETQLLAVDPTVDPDWHQNRTYLRVHATV